MLNFSQCLIKPEYVIGIHGGIEYQETLQSVLQQSYNIPIRFINISEKSSSSNRIENQSNISLLPDNEKIHKGKSFGIISKHFFAKIKSIPFVIFLVFDISQTNLYDNTLKLSICKTIEQIQIKHSKRTLIILLLSKHINQKESDTSSFILSIRSRIIFEKKYIVHIKGKLSLNNEKLKSKMLQLELDKIAFNYYKNKKHVYENIKKQTDPSQETIAKIAIKLAYISLLFQSEKLASAYYKEAYEIVMNKSLKPGDSIDNKKLFFIEQRNASDWLLVNIFTTLKMDNDTKKLALLNHLNQFDYELYFGKGVNDKKNTELDQTIIAMSYYWKICFEDYFNSLCDSDDCSELTAFNLIYSLMRLMNYLKINNDVLMKTTIDLGNIGDKESAYIEKINDYYSLKEDSNQKVFRNSDMILKILYKKFIVEFDMTQKGLSYKLIEKANKIYQLNDQWSNCQSSLKILLSSCDEIEDKDKEPLYNSLINTSNIELFPKVYINLLQKYNDVLLRMTPLNANQIIFNLIKISEFRDLTGKEYEIIKNILSEKMTTMQSIIFQVNSVNRLIQPSYTFSNYGPLICQLITFTLTIDLNIDDKIKFKVKSIILQFNHLTRTKKIMYTEDQSPVFSKNSPLVISYEIFIQPLDSNLFLSNVQLETQNGIIFLITIKEDVSKSLKTITEEDLKRHVSLVYPLNYIVGLNEYHLFSFEIQKKDEQITFDEIDAVFCFKDTNTIIPSHQFITCFNGSSDGSGDNSIYTDKLTIVHKELSNKLKRIDFLLKLSSKLKEEPYKLSFEIKIKISHLRLKSDYFLYEDKGVLNIKVRNSFECFHEIKSPCFIKNDAMITYPAKQKLMNFISIKNNLDFPFRIKSIKVIPFSNFIQLRSLYDNYFNKMPLLFPLSEFIIPIEIESEIETTSIGKIEIYWETTDLISYNPSMTNIDSFDLPNISIKQFDISVDAKVDDNDLMIVRLNNNTEFPCQTLLMIDNKEQCSSTIATGKTINKIMLLPYSSIDKAFGLISIDASCCIERSQIIIKVFKFGRIQIAQEESYSIIVQNECTAKQIKQ